MNITNENLVEAFRTSGLTQEAFSKKHNISIERLRYYLYKKNPEKPKPRKKQQKRSKAPAFISFNKEASTPVKNNDDTLHSYTIIHGKFSQNQLASFIKELGY